MTIRAGQQVSHYRLIAKIGEGGMGVVWKAEDTVLGRTVAIKVLPADVSRDEKRREMFLQEAQLASQVSAAHIVQVYEFGREGDLDFIVMEYVEGKPLDKMLHGRPLPAHKVAEFGYQIARALSKAHRRQLLHRDLKPANILVTADGDAKVVDFGLATLFETDSHSQAATRTTEEAPQDRKLAGTLSYMSPEQARMEQLDGRSDVFSLGSILYEMTTGQLPFTGRTPSDVLQAVQEARPTPVHDLVPQVPLELDRIIGKAMASRQRDRYQSIEDLAVDLNRLERELESGSSPSYEDLARTQVPDRRRKLLVGGVLGAVALVVIVVASWRFWPIGRAPDGAESDVESLAVLPFSVPAGDSDLEYLGDGIAESLIGRLTRVPDLRVMARGTVFRFKESAMDAVSIGRELKVGTVLSGHVERRGENLVFGAELVRVTDGAALWADRYAHERGDVLQVEDEIARAIAEALRLRLSTEQASRLTRSPTDSPEAYRLYLKGRHILHTFTYAEDVKAALRYFEQAIEKDSDFALAHVGLAHCHTLGGGEYLGLPSTQAYPLAEAAVTRALEIDPMSAEALAELATIRWEYYWAWSQAEEEYRRAIELNPGSVEAHHMYSQYLTAMGRHDEAIDEMKKAQDLDPLSLRISANLGGWSLYHARRYDEGITQVKHTLELDPDYGKARWYLGRLYLKKGMFEEAIVEFERLGSGWVGVPLAGLGKEREARQQIHFITQRSAGPSTQDTLAYEGEGLIALLAALGEHDMAFELLEQDVEQRRMHVPYFKVEPQLDPLRSDPRFDELLSRVGLPAG